MWVCSGPIKKRKVYNDVWGLGGLVGVCRGAVKEKVGLQWCLGFRWVSGGL